MARIKVNVEGLRDSKKAIQDKVGELQSLNARLDRLLSDIESSWEGTASEKYINGMRQHNRKAEQMVHVLEEFERYMDTAAVCFEEKDKSSASRIRSC